MTPEDLRAAVAAGIIDEAQAARLRVLAEGRAGTRAVMPAEDEPFEFFRGFSEIFISIGLVILLSGVTAMLSWFGGFALLTLVPLIAAGVAWWWARYFTLKRRMTLPSMVLASAFGGGVAIFFATALSEMAISVRAVGVLTFVLTAAALAGWYRRFRLPFTAALIGISLLLAIYAATTSFEDVVMGDWGWRGMFDLSENPIFASSTLVFGVGAFLAGMWFDTRDPHRLGRHAATAFWCHLLAAPALVNTVAVSLLNSGGGMALMALALLVITVLALVIDRRSFLTAAIAYIALVLAWFAGDDGDYGRWVFILMTLGALITAIGTWWVQLRAFVMKALPEFPGKSRLPPYARPE
ncbi:hypothetical protein Q9295_02305 [Xinfangfangia sp. CPCC 101601]|uniref:DUF2157 domain-containing protein n=1 Tax=Pseudogemmobacter lacusdianii TaxID=3069608 RepID=A0ABU0VU01_9RHOB|nr:hypothetical protein [Xinfangfangia sp. CPCC 101601]MDQ2065193.1 hypothetical protein [Xinfangfangia sp. CPCC 101601]